MTFGSTFGRVLSPTFQPKSQAAASSASTWWDLDGTITSCVAAYQPKGAASYAASLADLSGNDKNLTEATNSPGWDSTNGWKFTAGNNASNAALLNTGVTPANGYSMIVRFDALDGTTNRCVCGYNKTGARFRIYWSDSSNYVNYGNGGYLSVSPSLPSGILAVAGQYGYRDGTVDTTEISGWTTTADGSVVIGGVAAFTVNAFFGYVKALAIYNATLTGTQVGNLTTAMNAL